MTAVLLALLCGAVIGVVLGALGGGGSILAVPALVYVLGESARDATTASLVIVGVASALSVVGYHRDRLVRWDVGIAFGVVGIAASFAGTALNRGIPEPVLLSVFAIVMAASGVAMLLRQGAADRDTASSAPTGGRGHIAIQVVGAGLLVGFLTGLLGVGGGFVIVPALVLILGFSLPAATATSLLIIALNAAVSLGVRAVDHPAFDWSVIVPFTVATVATSYLGRRLARRVSPPTLTRAFAVLLLLLSLGIGTQTALAAF